MKNINLLLIILILLSSCGGFSDAGKVLRNEKVITNDEFLVKKRNPLVLPPNYEEIPEPDSDSKKEESNEDNFKKILKAPNKSSSSKNKPSSLEETILNRINKWIKKIYI